jgi:hypothetical protein
MVLYLACTLSNLILHHLNNLMSRFMHLVESLESWSVWWWTMLQQPLATTLPE